MNINLATNYPVDQDGTAESFQSQIDEHQEIMRNAGYALVGPAVLVPEPGSGFPGSYQVWNPYIDDAGNCNWVYVNPEGMALTMDFLPLAEDMEDKS